MLKILKILNYKNNLRYALLVFKNLIFGKRLINVLYLTQKLDFILTMLCLKMVCYD